MIQQYEVSELGKIASLAVSTALMIVETITFSNQSAVGSWHVITLTLFLSVLFNQ